jgi:tetrapyrrole methylase family protein/MazG family protein
MLTISGLGTASISLDALGIDLSRGLQIHAAPIVAGMYYPPLNPAQPALLTGLDSPEIARRLKQVLANQYPPQHEVRLFLPGGAGQQRPIRLPLDRIDSALGDASGGLLVVPPLDAVGSFESLQETMAHLRAPEGCPWDREQTHETLRPYLLEETYEALDALDAGDLNGLKEELGDLLLQVVFHVQVAIDRGEFWMADVIGHINRKLIHRHPHVWGEVSVSGADDVTRNWEAIKKQERNDNGKARASLLDGVSRALPALAQSYNYQARAARVGFDWEAIEPVLDKVREEIGEIQTAADPEARAREIGDLFFALVNWARWMDVEPETVLREANARFYRRFHYIELAADQAGRPLNSMTLAEMDALWEEAKAQGL